MPYATATNLINHFSAEEIAQRTDRELPRLVTAELLNAAAAGADLSAYSADEQARVAAALALIEDKLLDAESTVNGFLASRYTVPLITVPRLVMTNIYDLTRYALYDDMATEAITTRYNDAMKMLKLMADGKINLGVDVAGNKPATNQASQIHSGGRVFSRDDKSFI